MANHTARTRRARLALTLNIDSFFLGSELSVLFFNFVIFNCEQGVLIAMKIVLMIMLVLHTGLH